MAGGKRGGQGGRGAKAGSHRKGAAIGSGGQKRRALEGRGPTPPAADRKGHPAQRRAKRAEAPTGSAPRGAVKRTSGDAVKRTSGDPTKRTTTGATKRTGGGRAAAPTGRRPAGSGRPGAAGRPSTARRPS